MQHRFTTLDGMRGIAAIAVMLFHFTRHTSQPVFGAANLAVDLFFCLSGFVIAYSYRRRLQTEMSITEFLIKRLVRLYPMFIIGSIIGAFALLEKVAHGQTSLTPSGAVVAIALNSLYVPYLGDFYVELGNGRLLSATFPTNDPAWSLFFELVVNAVFAVWAIRSAKRSPLLLVVLGASSFVVYAGATHHIDPGWGAANFIGGFPRTLFGIFAGVFIFHTFDLLRLRLPKVHPAVISVLLVVMFGLVPNVEHGRSFLWFADILIFVPLLVALGSISNPENALVRRIFDYLGWISYPIYCVHYPIYSIYSLITRNADCGLQGALCCTVITIAVAHVASKHIEEPIRAMLSGSFFPLRKL